MDNTTVTSFFDVLSLVDDIMRKPYDIVDFIKIFSNLVHIWHRESANCGIQEGIDLVKGYCSNHGGCNVLAITLRITTYARTLEHLFF